MKLSERKNKSKKLLNFFCPNSFCDSFDLFSLLVDEKKALVLDKLYTGFLSYKAKSK